MVDLMKLEPRRVEGEPPEPAVEFRQDSKVRAQDRGRCLISVIPKVTLIC